MLSLHSLGQDGLHKSADIINSPLLQFLIDHSDERSIDILSQEALNEIIIIPKTSDATEERIDNENIDAGWTYFGQFISHDITTRREIGGIPPRLNLDSLYGAGPKANAHLYELDRDAFDEYTYRGVRFILNSYIGPAGEKVNDVYRTGPRSNVPIMGDVRNDENFILSQLHCAFMRFHNQMAEYFNSQNSYEPEALFRKTRKFVTHTYQWLIMYDYLPMLTGNGNIDIMGNTSYKLLYYKNKFLETPVLMPEFNLAAFRIGHSQVRSFYQINGRSNPHLFQDVNHPQRPTLKGFMRDLERGPVDWRFLFTFGNAPFIKVEKSRPVDLVITMPLGALPFLKGSVESNLGRININRSMEHQLCIFKTDLTNIREHLKIPTLEDFSELDKLNLPLIPAWQNCKARLLSMEYWPLWIFVLVEAMLKGTSEYKMPKMLQHLGPLGGQIILEQILWILQRDPESFIYNEPGWSPMEELNKHYKPIKERFSIVDVLHIAEHGI